MQTQNQIIQMIVKFIAQYAKIINLFVHAQDFNLIASFSRFS